VFQISDPTGCLDGPWDNERQESRSQSPVHSFLLWVFTVLCSKFTSVAARNCSIAKNSLYSEVHYSRGQLFTSIGLPEGKRVLISGLRGEAEVPLAQASDARI